MNKEEMKLKVHYELRNHIGAMALDDDQYHSLYKRIRKDQTKRYLEECEERWNEKLEKRGYLSLLDVYDDLGIDTEYQRFLISCGKAVDAGWMTDEKEDAEIVLLDWNPGESPII